MAGNAKPQPSTDAQFLIIRRWHKLSQNLLQSRQEVLAKLQAYRNKHASNSAKAHRVGALLVEEAWVQSATPGAILIESDGATLLFCVTSVSEVQKHTEFSIGEYEFTEPEEEEDDEDYEDEDEEDDDEEEDDEDDDPFA